MALIDVIKYEGGNNILVWKHPVEDFNTSAQLIVHETQEAIIVKDGQFSAPFFAGKYTIDTENIPGVRRIVEIATDGISPNHYEVYFINKACSMEVYWGTRTPWSMQDPTFEMSFNMRAHGQCAVRVVDSEKLMRKLVGTTTSFSKYALQDYFSPVLTSNVKIIVSQIMEREGIGYSTITTKLDIIARELENKITNFFSKFGLSVEEMVIESVEVIEDKYLEQIKEAQAIRTANIIKGVTIQEVMGYDVAKAQAQNAGVGGQIGNTISGVAAGAAIGPAVGQIVSGVMQGTNAQNIIHPDQFSMGTSRRYISNDTVGKSNICRKCGARIRESAKFCDQCGAVVSDNKIICPACGESLPPDSKFCQVCGKEINHSEE